MTPFHKLIQQEFQEVTGEDVIARVISEALDEFLQMSKKSVSPAKYALQLYTINHQVTSNSPVKKIILA